MSAAPQRAPACAVSSLGQPLGSAPTLVLAHALGTDGGMWAPQYASFGAGHHLLVLDLPGHGRSRVPARPCTLEALTTVVLDAIDAAGVTHFRFCGVSLGALLGLSIALTVPERVDALVVSNTAARIGSAESWQARIAAVQASGLDMICDAVFARWFAPSFVQRRPALHAELQRTFRTLDPAGYTACCEALAAADLRTRVAGIRAPTLVLGGERDEPTPPAEAHWLHAQIAGSELTVLPRAAHLANLDCSEAFNDRVRRFLEARA